MDKLHNVLLAYYTINRTSIGMTIFSLTYGVEGIILLEIGMLIYKM